MLLLKFVSIALESTKTFSVVVYHLNKNFDVVRLNVCPVGRKDSGSCVLWRCGVLVTRFYLFRRFTDV